MGGLLLLLSWGGVLVPLSLQLFQLQLLQLPLFYQLLTVEGVKLLTPCIALPRIPFCMRP